ncbi:MAG: ElaA protein [Glaciecola sp.]|jgi:ElaA protein
MKILCVPFSDLSTAQLYRILQLRSEVFVLEQTCIYQDLDDKDIKAGVHHLMMIDGIDIVAYARLLPASISYDTPSIGRILVAPSKRGTGLGKELIAKSVEVTQSLWPSTAITIGAQSHLSKLYRSFGFIEMSEHYLEDDIMHVDMRLDK